MRTVRVVDEAGAPIAGAHVHVSATISTCGPSGPLEGCSFTPIESPDAITDARGTASVCDVGAAAGRPGRSFVTIEHEDGAPAGLPLDAADPIVMGPPRSLLVDVPVACKAMTHVHVIAQTEGGPLTWAQPLLSGMRSRRYKLERLGPWRYWVSTTDDRSGNGALEADACPTFIRIVDTRHPPDALVLDRSDAVVEFPGLAGARATVTPFRSAEITASATLDADGRATFALPASRGSVFCLRLEHEGSCRITYARAGEIARPGMYAGREAEIEASCGRCAP